MKDVYGFYLVFNVGLLGLVEMNLNETRAVQLNSNPFADDFWREAEVFKNGVVDSCKGSATAKQQESRYLNLGKAL